MVKFGNFEVEYNRNAPDKVSVRSWKTLRNAGVTVLTLCIALRRMLKAEFGWARIIAV